MKKYVFSVFLKLLLLIIVISFVNTKVYAQSSGGETYHALQCQPGETYTSGCGGGGNCSSSQVLECTYYTKPDGSCGGNNCHCINGANCASPTDPPNPPNDPTNTPGPGTTTCTRCSNIHGCQIGTWTNQITNPSTPCEPVIPIGSVTYINDTINCGPLDPIPSGGDNNACPTNPSATPTPTGTDTVNCETCSSLPGKENCKVTWYDPDGKCDDNFYNNRTEDCSATSGCSSTERNCNRCSNLPGKEHCRVYWTDTTSGNCTANFYNNRQMNCSASSGCPESNLTGTPTPTPTSGPTNTPVPGCLCKTDGTCAAVCAFEKFSDITYISPVKCSLSPLLFASTITPSATNKNSWCQRTKRTKGDANGDGVIDGLDLGYYVAAVNGGKISINVNPDFDGDGVVSNADRDIIVKTYNQ